MILLEKYIKSFLNEAASSAIIGKASDLTGKSQHQSAAAYSSDMSEIDSQETLLKVLENVGDNCFISFVEKYDEKIPRLEVSPKVSYDTPHGNYAYPLTVKSLKDIIEKGRIGGASFALERPYFHMFKKSAGLNSIEIESDGSNNYAGNFAKDLKTISHTAVMFAVAMHDEKNPSRGEYPGADEYFKFALNKIKRLIDKPIDIQSGEYIYAFQDDFEYLINQLHLIRKCSTNRVMPVDVLNLVVDFVCKYILLLSKTTNNIFFDKRKKTTKSKFHDLYYACWFLSRVLSDEEEDNYPTEDDNKIAGPIFTMLLNSIDVDFINDKGSSTLHSSEPIQAVYLNSSKKENVVLVGTFNNIFSTRKINSIDDLFAAYNESSSSSRKGPTMNKVVDIIERNPHLQDLFGTELFDDVKLEHALEDLREKAYADLTKNKLVFVKFLRFHSANKVFDLNIYVGKNKLIVFDMGFKGKFLKANINQQLIMIKKSLPEIAQIESNLSYLQVFLSKYHKKNVYTIRGMNALSNMSETLDKIQDYTANIEIKSEEDKNMIMTLHLFIYNAEEIMALANIAHSSSLHNG